MPTSRAQDRTEPAVIVGAIGAIGARLVESEVPLRLASRWPEAVHARWPDIEAVGLDVLWPETIKPALTGADTAYYLVHAMGGSARRC